VCAETRVIRSFVKLNRYNVFLWLNFLESVNDLDAFSPINFFPSHLSQNTKKRFTHDNHLGGLEDEAFVGSPGTAARPLPEAATIKK